MSGTLLETGNNAELFRLFMLLWRSSSNLEMKRKDKKQAYEVDGFCDFTYSFKWHPRQYFNHSTVAH